jgi:hypothetical protein
MSQAFYLIVDVAFVLMAIVLFPRHLLSSLPAHGQKHTPSPLELAISSESSPSTTASIPMITVSEAQSPNSAASGRFPRDVTPEIASGMDSDVKRKRASAITFGQNDIIIQCDTSGKSIPRVKVIPAGSERDMEKSEKARMRPGTPYVAGDFPTCDSDEDAPCDEEEDSESDSSMRSSKVQVDTNLLTIKAV